MYRIVKFDIKSYDYCYIVSSFSNNLLLIKLQDSNGYFNESDNLLVEYKVLDVIEVMESCSL